MRMWEFVDSITPSPTIRLDLNSYDTGLLVTDNWNLDPPPLRRVVTTTSLVDGSNIPAAAWDDRVIRLEIQLLTPGTAAAATAIQSLLRELNRPSNILRVRLGQDDPRYFRTKRAPDATITNVVKYLLDSGVVTIDIPAEPFAYGLPEVVEVGTVTTDPVDGCVIDIPADTVIGDVETPPVITIGPWTTAAYPSPARAIIATRRRGDPTALTSWFAQGESITSSYAAATTTDSAAAYSGGGAAFVHFAAGNEAMSPRFNVLMPNGPEATGTYRIFAAMQREVSQQNIRMQWRTRVIADVTTYSAYSLPVATLAANNRPVGTPGYLYYNLVDLGVVTIPFGQPTVEDGYSGVARSVTTTPEVRLGIAMSSDDTGGSGVGARVDYIAFVPADESLCMIGGGDAGYDDSQIILDGPNDTVLIADSTGAVVQTVAPISRAGALPMLSPAIAQRIYVLREAWAGPPATDAAFEQNITITYYPRYLYVS